MSLFKNSPEKLKKKKGKEPIVGITAYDYVSARLCEEAKVDFILVGDSAAMVMLGEEDTYGIGMEEMLLFAKAVSRGAPNTLRIGDMPFLSYQVSMEKAILNAGRFLKEGKCHAVKIEGGEEVAEKVYHIVRAGIPVMGHIGLTPQRTTQLGGLKIQGKTEKDIKKLLKDAKTLEEAGAFAIVIECVPEKVGEELTKMLNIPTIGIGAGRFTDGQILVYHDVLGLFPDLRPKFVKTYTKGFELFKTALENYVKEVKEKIFPSKDHIY